MKGKEGERNWTEAGAEPLTLLNVLCQHPRNRPRTSPASHLDVKVVRWGGGSCRLCRGQLIALFIPPQSPNGTAPPHAWQRA